MPDPSQSAGLIQSRILNPTDIREIETLEIIQPSLSLRNSEVDIAFLIDVTGSMSDRIDVLASSLGGIAADLKKEFSGIRFGLMTFKDEDYIEFDSNSEFVNLSAFQALVGALTSGGGDDTAEAGYYAVVKSCRKFEWRESASVFRAAILFTDAPSHERSPTSETGAPQSMAIADLASYGVRFYNVDYDDDSTYSPLAVASGGQFIEYSSDAEDLKDRIVEAILNIETQEGTPPIYLVNDTVSLTALDENGVSREYLTRAFAIGVSGEGTTGVRAINLTIDNSDLEVSRYLANAIKKNLPIEVVYRLYLSNDSSQPQNDPPLRIFLSSVEVAGTTVSGELTWFDLSNAPFPNAYYTRDKFPTIG